MKIRAAIDSSELNMSNSETPAQRVIEHPMTDLVATSEGEMQRIIQAAKTKSLSLDPLPTSLLKNTLSAHIPTLTHLINFFFESGTVPWELKKAVITLLLKSLPFEKPPASFKFTICV